MAQINNASTHVVDNGSNVKFLLGTQDALEGYITGSKQASNGTFYLTKDTHRVYVGTKDKVAVPVNEGVISVDDKGKAPGRGAYLCHNVECLNKAYKAKLLERNLDTQISEEVFEKLKERFNDGQQ